MVCHLLESASPGFDYALSVKSLRPASRSVLFEMYPLSAFLIIPRGFDFGSRI